MSDDNRFSNNSHDQCKRLLEALIEAKSQGVTTYVASTELGIYHPPARIKQLREQGYEIITQWRTIETANCLPRRVGNYILISQSKGGNAA